MAAENARSREKTGLPALEGDEDLVLYYYLVMHGHTSTGQSYRDTDSKRFRLEVLPKLVEQFGEQTQYPYWFKEEHKLEHAKRGGCGATKLKEEGTL